jgi:hypothetical protein
MGVTGRYNTDTGARCTVSKTNSAVLYREVLKVPTVYCTAMAPSCFHFHARSFKERVL